MIYLHVFLLIFFRIKKHKKRRRGVDYNAEIPFEKKPAPGTYCHSCFIRSSIKQYAYMPL